MAFWYLATPYSKFPGGIEAAFLAACQQAACLVRAGIRVYSPIAHTHPIAVHGGIDPYAHEIWMPVDQPFMDAAEGLIVCKLPTWEESKGVAFEIEEFKKAGKPIVWMDPDVAPAPESLAALVPKPIGDPRFHALLKQIGELHDRKQADYGVDSDPFANIRASVEFGIPPWVGSILRGNDKMKRIKSFITKGNLKNESVEDSLMDLAVYALISLILYREQHSPCATKPKQADAGPPLS